MPTLEITSRDGGVEHRDRSAGLLVFGIVEIAIGVLCALMIPLALVATAATASMAHAPPQVGIRSLISSLSLYAVLAAVFMWLGIGCILARRWARVLTLVLSWLWLAGGVPAFILTCFMVPAFGWQIGDATGLSAAGVVLVEVAVVAATAVIHVLLPGVLVLFFRSRDVAATCRVRDPVPRWTDHCPAHLISLLVLYLFVAYSLLLAPLHGPVVPLFGHIVSGGRGVPLVVVLLALCAYLVQGIFRRDMRSWWVSLAASTLATVSLLVTLWRQGAAVLLARLELPPDQLQLIVASGLAEQPIAVALIVVTWATFAGYLVFVRHYFDSAARLPQGEAGGPVA